MRYSVNGIWFDSDGPYWLNKRDMETVASLYAGARPRIAAYVASHVDGVSAEDALSLLGRPVIDGRHDVVRYESHRLPVDGPVQFSFDRGFRSLTGFRVTGSKEEST